MKASTVLILSLLGGHALGQAEDLPSFRHVTIDDKVRIGYGIAIADMNADKKPDIVLCDARNIAWYQNPSWKKHIIVENLTQRDHVCIAVRDIDGDGRAEIAAGAGLALSRNPSGLDGIPPGRVSPVNGEPAGNSLFSPLSMAHRSNSMEDLRFHR